MSDAYVPAVVIVGRPNVGKSTLFNIIARQLVSIVEKTPGVTRDRVIRTVTWGRRRFDLIDTGGIGIVDEEKLAADVEHQIEVAIEAADLILYMVDIQTGVHEEELKIAKKLHKMKKDVILIANKADSPKKEEGQYEFMALGFGEPIMISAKGKRNLKNLEKRVSGSLPDIGAEIPDDDDGTARIAIVGRRNVGKSSLVNALAEEERVIVSNVPGTTRDPIDVIVKRKKKEYVLVDTAGLLQTSQRKDLEFYGSIRTERSINRANGVVLMLDAVAGIGRVDKKVAADIANKYKPCVIVVNKWDLSGDVITDDYLKYIARELPGLRFAPVVFTSVHERNHIWAPIKVVTDLIAQARIELKTPKLNKIIQDAIKKKKPPTSSSKRPKIYYAVQVGTLPPSFRIFTNDAALFRKGYRRFIANSIRAESEICEIPLKIYFVTKPRGREREREKAQEH